MSKKIKMLVIPSDRTGVGKFRSVAPHTYIQEHYGDEFDVDIVYSMPKGDLEALLMTTSCLVMTIQCQLLQKKKGGMNQSSIT